jgi:hypothetical protein
MSVVHGLQLLGLVLGFIGALLLALAQAEGGISDVTAKREHFYLLLAHPKWWKWGMRLLCAAFLIQVIGEVL